MNSAPGGICTHASFSDSTLKFGNWADSDDEGDDFFSEQKVPQTPLTQTLTDKFAEEEQKRNSEIKSTMNAPKDREMYRESCYGCNPDGEIAEYIISSTDKYIFQFDMMKRPIVMLTPVQHYTKFFDMELKDRNEIVDSINQFCLLWNIKNYQIHWGNEESDKHFHIKIKMNEFDINKIKKLSTKKSKQQLPIEYTANSYSVLEELSV